MGTKLDAVLTPVTCETMLAALASAWFVRFGVEATRASLNLLVAQWALETGEGRSMYCFNIGNVKCPDPNAGDYCYFTTTEDVSRAVAMRAVAMATVNARAEIAHDGGGEIVIVRVFPEHPWARFRAFRTLDDGATFYLDTLTRRFAGAWPYVLAGDVDGFAAALKALRYFTAPVALYAAGMRRELDSIAQLPSPAVGAGEGATS